ncbi:MAG: adenine phosphoribosyltransferase [Thermoplasmatota archaeon]
MIKDSLAAAPILDKSGYPYIIHPLTDGVPRMDVEELREWAAWAMQQPGVDQATLLLAPEAMAIPVATALSLLSGKPMVIARKRQYGLPGETIAYCETGYGESCIYLNDIRPDDKVLIVDDLISTGGTLRGLMAALDERGATVIGCLAIVEKGTGAQAIRDDTGLPIQAMHRIHVDQRVHVDP